MYYSGIYSQSALINLQAWMCEQSKKQQEAYLAHITANTTPVDNYEVRIDKDKPRAGKANQQEQR